MPGVGSSLGSESESPSTGASSFHLTNVDPGFSDRSKDVFGVLETLEVKHEAVHSVQSQAKTDDEKSTLVKPDPCEESTETPFRPPRGRARKQRYVPGYRKDPQKWTPYNLADVPPDQLSDRANTSAAFAFLQERKVQREEAGASPEANPVPESGKVEFTRPQKRQCPIEEEAGNNEKHKFRDGKRMMPEYVVGQEKRARHTTKHKPSSTATSSADTIGLVHLNDSDENEVEGHTKEEVAAESSSSKPLKNDWPIAKPREGIEDEAGGSDSKTDTTEVPKVTFKKVTGKRGIRRKRVEEDENDDE